MRSSRAGSSLVGETLQCSVWLMEHGKALFCHHFCSPSTWMTCWGSLGDFSLVAILVVGGLGHLHMQMILFCWLLTERCCRGWSPPVRSMDKSTTWFSPPIQFHLSQRQSASCSVAARTMSAILILSSLMGWTCWPSWSHTPPVSENGDGLCQSKS